MASIWFVFQIVCVKSGSYRYAIYAPDGRTRYQAEFGPLGSRDDKSRIWIKLNEIPQTCLDMLLIAEDPGFYEHRGLNVSQMWQAFLANLREQRFAFGGSTLTQQLVKNLFLWRNKTVLRKSLEIIGASILDVMMSKEEQLEWYFNVAELGPNIYGINHGSFAYFGKSSDLLQPVECVMLTSMLTEPINVHRLFFQGKYSVFNYEKAIRMMNKYVQINSISGDFLTISF